MDLVAAALFVAAVAFGFYAGYSTGWEAHSYAARGLRVSILRMIMRRVSGGRVG